MPHEPASPSTCTIVDAAAFDLSDADDVDIVSSPAPFEPSPTRSAAGTRDRARLADAVLALCALWVFKDRRRKATYGLPGI